MNGIGRYHFVDVFGMFNILGQMLFVGIALLFVLSFMKSKQRHQQLVEIQNFSARLANLRLILKAKIKKKTNYYRNAFPIPLVKEDVIDRTLNQICDLKFEIGHDFQTYIDFSRSVNRFLQMSLAKSEKEAVVEESKKHSELAIADGTNLKKEKTSKKNQSTFRSLEVNSEQIIIEGPNNFMTPDVKNELEIVKIMDELISLNLKLRDKTIHFNTDYPKNQLPLLDPIQFESQNQLRGLFQSNPELNTATIDETIGDAA